MKIESAANSITDHRLIVPIHLLWACKVEVLANASAAIDTVFFSTNIVGIYARNNE